MGHITALRRRDSGCGVSCPDRSADGAKLVLIGTELWRADAYKRLIYTAYVHLSLRRRVWQ